MLIADSPRRYVGAAVFATSLILLYASSASYHLVPWPDATARGDEAHRPLDDLRLHRRHVHAVLPHRARLRRGASRCSPSSGRWRRPACCSQSSGRTRRAGSPSPPYLALGWIGVIPAVQVVSGDVDCGSSALLMLGRRVLHDRRRHLRATLARSLAARVRLPRGLPRVRHRRQRHPLRPHRHLRRQRLKVTLPDEMRGGVRGCSRHAAPSVRRLSSPGVRRKAAETRSVVRRAASGPRRDAERCRQ